MRYLLRCLFPCLLMLLGCGGGGGSNPAPQPAVPAPTQFKAAAGANVDEVILSWVAPAAPIDGYELEARIGEAAFEKIHTGLIPSDYSWLSLSFNASAPEMTVYAFRLRAAKNNLFSAYSSEATHTRGPNAPLGVTGQMDWDKNGIVVIWTRNSSVSDGVTVERSECSAWGGLVGSWTPLVVADPQATTILDTSTQADRYYTYRVINKKGDLSSAPSGASSPVFTGMPAPLQLVASYDWEQGAIRLVWNRNTDGADRVRIERVECSAWGSPLGEWSSLAFSDPLASTCLDGGVRMGAYYLYRIANLRGSLTSATSASYPVFAGLPAPGYLSASWDVARKGMLVTWTPNTTASDSVRLERGECDGNGSLIGGWGVVATLPAATQNYLDSVVEEGRNYYYRATNLRGTVESPATQSSYWTSVPLLAPVNLQVANTATGFKITWENRSAAANEIVLRRALGIDPWSWASDVALLSPGTTTYEDVGMGLGCYTYYAVAKKGSLQAASLGAQAVSTNPPGALTLKSSLLDLPDASDGDLRPQGNWAFATMTPLGVRANAGDPWQAHFPSFSVYSVPSSFMKVDSKGWPHLVVLHPNPQNANESLVTHDWYDGSAWKNEDVATTHFLGNSANFGMTFCLDRSDELHLLVDRSTDASPYGGTTDTLAYLHKVNGAWVAESLAPIDPKVGNIGTYHVFVDGLDRPHILLGNWGTVVEFTKDSAGKWLGQTLPSGNASAGWYDFLEGLWSNPDNGWVFYERGGSSITGMSYSLVALQKKGGVWQSPVVLGSRAHDGSSTTARGALSRDGGRVAVAYRSTHGLRVFHQDSEGWHETLAGPDPGAYPFLKIGFDGSGLLHLIQKKGEGFLEFGEQVP